MRGAQFHRGATGKIKWKATTPLSTNARLLPIALMRPPKERGVGCWLVGANGPAEHREFRKPTASQQKGECPKSTFGWVIVTAWCSEALFPPHPLVVGGTTLIFFDQRGQSTASHPTKKKKKTLQKYTQPENPRKVPPQTNISTHSTQATHTNTQPHTTINSQTYTPSANKLPQNGKAIATKAA